MKVTFPTSYMTTQQYLDWISFDVGAGSPGVGTYELTAMADSPSPPAPGIYTVKTEVGVFTP